MKLLDKQGFALSEHPPSARWRVSVVACCCLMFCNFIVFLRFSCRKSICVYLDKKMCIELTLFIKFYSHGFITINNTFVMRSSKMSLNSNKMKIYSYSLVKTSSQLDLWFQRYSHFSAAQNNEIQRKLNTIIFYLRINISEFRLILFDDITF